MPAKKDVELRLKNAFKELAKEQPVDKITIHEITERAGVIRTTFYHHYQDKYELMEQIVREEIILPIEPLLENDMINEAIRLIFSNLMREKELYMKLAKTSGQNSFEQIAQKCVMDILYRVVGGKLKAGIDAKTFQKNWLSPEMLSSYYSRTIAFAVMYWIDMGMPYSPREIADIYEYIISHSLQDVVDELRLGGG